MSKKTILVAALLVAAVSAGVVLIRLLRTDSGVAIRFSGNIELTEVGIAFKTAGKLVERTLDEGDAVTKGMIIARLDREQVLRQRDRARASLSAAESQIPQLQAAIRYQRETAEGQVSQRTAEISQAESRLRDLLAGSRPQEIEQGKAAVERARTEHEWAQSDWERAQKLYKNEDISTAQYDQFRSRTEAAAAALKQAEEQLSLIREGPRAETIAAARSEVARARAALSQAQALRLEVERRVLENETRKAEVERARAELAVIESQLADTEVTSPIDGVVLVKSAEVGDVLAAGATVVTIGDVDHPWLRGYIREQDLGRVQLGARASITTDSFPGRIYSGRVSFISSQAEFTPKQIQTPEERVKLVYRIKVDIANPERELKLNMPADAEIRLEK
ncbi:MAG: HlyD family efflux transporter periplasmic adaptor subunit [Acidobacteria bacterium]|nr:HlyD family efflux transporter periplasmic adaptor subunit [Acidobacteriota bacterium]